MKTLFGILLVPAIATTLVSAGASAQPAPIDMHGCVAHTSFNGGPDYPNDYRCAGAALDYHLSGVAHSPAPLWAGQWLFVDENGTQLMGWCTFNRGIHPDATRPATRVVQSFPNDPTGAKSAYLTWKYREHVDDLTAAGLWAVFHYYAQDAAGSNRSANPSAPLVPSLDAITAAAGRQDIADAAIALDAEAVRFTQPFVLTADLSADGSGVARLMAGEIAVDNAEIEIDVSGASFDDDASSVVLTTDGNGMATFEVVGPPQEVTVTASASAPGEAYVYRGVPVDPIGHLPQNLLTAGPSRVISATASIALAAPTTSTTPESTTTTTIAPTTTTTVVDTTTTVAPTTTVVDTTTSTTSAPASDVPSTTIASFAPPPPTPPSLPKTGGSSTGVAYVGTALLVAGFGIVGALRRRQHRSKRGLPHQVW